MIKAMLRILCFFGYLMPTLVLVAIGLKTNLKRKIRNRQIIMPVIAVLYCVFMMIIMLFFGNWAYNLVDKGVYFLQGKLNHVQALKGVIPWIRKILDYLGTPQKFWVVLNLVFMLLYLIVKRVIITLLRVIARPGNNLHQILISPFYEESEEDHQIYLKERCAQTRKFLKGLYIGTVIVMTVLAVLSCELYRIEWIDMPFYPVIGYILMGELFFALNGMTRREALGGAIDGEEDESSENVNYSLMKETLKKLFPDKLSVESTSINNGFEEARTRDELISELTNSDEMAMEAYGRFIQHRMEKGFVPDEGYLEAGRQLLNGESVLFNNPFYYDLIPYLFYPMNRLLMNHQKVLIVLGRHGVEEDIINWCTDGFISVNNTPYIWNVKVLDDANEERVDVGIVTRSMVHELAVHEKNAAFLKNVGMVVLVEPSKLLTTAQIGLNSIVRHCSQDDRPLVFCSVDKNCDGLVDALSHILMTSIKEVSATVHHHGTSTYMVWDGDSDHLQHRMLPNLSRYLGFGTELSIAAIRNQIDKTQWYGGEAFPVVDTKWIADQYYYDLMNYCSLPGTQKELDAHFHVSSGLWNAQLEKKQYITVEDEFRNMFEIKRNFATRASEEGFINIITSDYLLKDYMTANDGIFSADSKAIPYIVADYAHTRRNITLRLCLRMSTLPIWESELVRELALIGASVNDPAKSLWHELCESNQPLGKAIRDEYGDELLVLEKDGIQYKFKASVIQKKRRFNIESHLMETIYQITDPDFGHLVLDDLKNAEYIAEDEQGEKLYLGTEIRGQIFQKYLPGQFFTLGGKHYEMLRTTFDGKVVLRRAADHITGRPAYRQLREYEVRDIRASEMMGDNREIPGLQVGVCYADFKVATPGYWKLDRYQDFKGARRTMINGIPERIFNNKKLLKLGFEGMEEPITPEIRRTLTLLLNEVFTSIFPDNQSYIAAVTPGECEIPLTYQMTGQGLDENAIYIIEDSQLDIGLLEAVQRNLDRIFQIISDYLDWHEKTLEESLNPPEPVVEPEPEPIPEAEPEQPQKVGFFRRIWNKIKGFFRKIKEFFARLFKRKKKDEPTPTEGEPVAEPIPAEGEPAAEPEAAEPEAVEAEPQPAEGEPEAAEAEPQPEPTEEPATEAENADTTEATEDPEEPEIQMEMAPPAAATMLTDVPAEAEAPAPPAEGTTVEFEPEETVKVNDAIQAYARKPYHERYYLLFGGSEIPEGIEVAQTKAFLIERGYDGGELRQARLGKGLSQMIENDFVPGQPGKHYCDFCGCELIGTEYEVLKDGRERCVPCSRTAIKTQEEFVRIYREVLNSMQRYFGIRIDVPIQVKMVNAKKLHRSLGRTFVPSGKYDGRVLGVAVHDSSGYTLMVENGAPRMQSMMTMAHEMTHIWQYTHWDRKKIRARYGKDKELEIYEGMAEWVEIQFAYLRGEIGAASREEIITRARKDAYGIGFLRYVHKYPLTKGTGPVGATPFQNPEEPV